MLIAQVLRFATVVTTARSVALRSSDQFQSFTQRQAEDSFFKGWVALGDSYSAGPGAGAFHADGPNANECLRYEEAYPLQMTQGIEGGTICPVEGIQPLFLSCTSASINSMPGYPHFQDQLDYIHGLGDQDERQFDFATLSIGGNDLGFPIIARYCFYPLLFDGPSTGKCNTALENAERLLDINGDGANSEFRQSLTAAYKNVIDEMYYPIPGPLRQRATGRFHLFITGYTNFFNDTDSACNNLNFGLPLPIGWPPGGQTLTQAFRARVNKLVERLNDRARQVATEISGIPDSKYTGKISFVEGVQDDYTNHRFCDNNNIHNWDLVWYFEPDLIPVTGDNANPNPQPMELPMNLTSQQAVTAVDGYYQDPGFAQRVFDAIKAAEPNTDDATIWGRVAIGATRTFHPTKSGYIQMRNRVCDFLCYQFRDSHPSCRDR